jgi:hypothetical protein
MTKVIILPIPTEKGKVSYRAVAGDRQSHGRTAGEALDALTTQLSEDEANTLVIVQSLRPDRFFDAAQRQRLGELMERWHTERDKGQTLPADVQTELEALVEAELRAVAVRAATLADELKR